MNEEATMNKSRKNIVVCSLEELGGHEVLQITEHPRFPLELDFAI